MLRICDVCGEVDDLPRDLVSCAPGEAPAVDQAMLNAVLQRTDLADEVKASIVADLSNNTLMIRHIDGCVPFDSTGGN